MKRLYHQLVRRWGEPKDIWVFDPHDLPDPGDLRLVHVAAWPADKHCKVTSFNTLGMSEERMKGADYFAELNLGFRGKLTKKQRLALAGMLANVVEYPFENDLKLDWWEVINRPGTIPVFTGCRHLLLHPKFNKEGIDYLDDPDGPVKLLYVVPITPQERHLLVDHGRDSFIQYLVENEVDLFVDRWAPPKWYVERT